MRTAQQTYDFKAGARQALYLGVALAMILTGIPGVVGSHTPAHNAAPVLDPVGDRTIAENATLQFELTASDANGDAIIWEIANKPAGAVFQDNTTYQAYFKWRPTFTQAGVYQVTFKVRDEYTSDTETINITVTNTNRAPTMGFLHNKWIEELAAFDMPVFASDPDNDPLALTLEVDMVASALTPSDVVVTPNARIPLASHFADGGDGDGAFAWTPLCTQGAWDPPRPYHFWANVTDGTATFTRNFTIYVIDVNAPPTFDTIPLTSVAEGDDIELKIIVRNCDGPVLENHYLDVGTVDANLAGVTPPAIPNPLPDDNISWIPDRTPTLYPHANVFPQDEKPWHPGVPSPNTNNVSMLYDPIEDYYYATLFWNTTFQEAGNYTFYAQVFDGGLDRRTSAEVGVPGVQYERNMTFNIIVGDENTKPEILLPTFHDAATETYFGKEDTRFFQVSPLNALGDIWLACAFDAEDDVVYWEVDWLDVPGVQLPPGLRLTVPDPDLPASASCIQIQWEFTYEQPGTYHFRVDLSDGDANDREFFNITVENTNRRPFIDPIAPQVVFENELLIVNVTGFDDDMTDPDYPDFVDIIAAGIPPGAQWQYGHGSGDTRFNGVFKWTPGYHQEGLYTVTLKAVDWDPTSELPATPLDPVSDLEYIAPPVLPVEPEEYNWTRAFTISVLNVDRAPECFEPLDQTWMELQPVTVFIECTDADDDPISLLASPLPPGATFTDFGDGTGRLDWTPGVGQFGIYDVVFTAFSGLPVLTDSVDVRIVIVHETDFEICPCEASDPTIYASAVPTVPVQLTAVVENTAPLGTDLLTFEVTTTNGAVADPIPATFIAAGAGPVNVTFNVTVPSTASQFQVTVKATSTLDPALFKSTNFVVRVPVSLAITMTNTLPGVVEGFANLTYADGSPVAGVTLTATQRPLDVPNPFNLLTTSVSGDTDSSGIFVFSFLGDVAAGLPGEHELTVSGSYFSTPVSLTTTYTVP